MPRQIEPSIITVNNFSGGISDSTRKSSDTECSVTKHFDLFSDPKRLIPYRSLETDTETATSATDLKQYLVRDFVYASTSAKLYGLGQTSGGLAKIFQKADATIGLWTLPATSEGNGVVKNGCFFEYKDYLWGFQGTTQLFKWGLLSGSPSITNTAKTVGATITSVANGIIQPSTGFAYVAYNNVIVRIESNTTTITDIAKTVPTNLKITSLCNFGNNIAIGCSPISSFSGTSKVFIWNGASDLFTETLDFGEGDLRVLEVVEGVLVGIVDRYLNNSAGAGKGSMVVMTYAGGSPQVVKEIFTKALVGKTIPVSKFIKNNRLFWAAKIMTNSAGTEYDEGIWSFGRKNVNYPYVITIDIVDQNVNTSGIEAIGLAGNYFFIAHSTDGSVDKTNDASVFAFTSVYESQIFSFGDASVLKRLDKFSIYTAPIPTSGSVTVKYKIDAETSFTTIGTLNTVGQLSRDFYNIESSGVDFPTFKEIQFRLESVTGGAEITGFKIVVLPLIGSTG